MNSFLPGLAADRLSPEPAESPHFPRKCLWPLSHGARRFAGDRFPHPVRRIRYELSRPQTPASSMLHRTAISKCRSLCLNYATELSVYASVDIHAVYSTRPPTYAISTHLAGDASSVALESLLHASSPPFVLNIAARELLRSPHR